MNKDQLSQLPSDIIDRIYDQLTQKLTYLRAVSTAINQTTLTPNEIAAIIKTQACINNAYVEYRTLVVNSRNAVYANKCAVLQNEYNKLVEEMEVEYGCAC